MPDYQSLTDDFSQLKFDYVYIPAILLVLGTAIVKVDWTMYSAAVAILWGAYNFYNLRESIARRAPRVLPWLAIGQPWDSGLPGTMRVRT